MENRIYSLLGITKKAGKVIAGETSCENAIKKGKVLLLIISDDISDTSYKRFNDLCKHRGIKNIKFGNRYNLGKAVGKNMHTVIGINDRTFADKLLNLIKDSELANKNGGEANI